MGGIDYSRIELLVLDIDGVMTDGKIILTPQGEEIKEFHVRDGSGLKFWQRAGRKSAIITGRASPAVAKRGQELGIDVVRLGEKQKYPTYRGVLEQLGVKPQNACVIGDDLMELPMMLNCGLPVAVADAVAEVRQAAAYTTMLPGGHGCVREVIEMILRGAGLWAGLIERYYSPAVGGDKATS